MSLSANFERHLQEKRQCSFLRPFNERQWRRRRKSPAFKTLLNEVLFFIYLLLFTGLEKFGANFVHFMIQAYWDLSRLLFQSLNHLEFMYMYLAYLR